MTYVSWAVLYEGDTDAAYFDVLIPRLLEDAAVNSIKLTTIPTAPVIRLERGSPKKVAEEACSASEAFDLIFIHADTGGRALERDMHGRGLAFCEALRAECHWPADRCILLAPRHETEAWVVADPHAVTGALGYTGSPASIGLPQNAPAAERLSDPKQTLQHAVATVRGRRRTGHLSQIYPAIAQRQRMQELRRASSFQAFEAGIVAALRHLRVVT